jgi:hypothetical protein
MRGAYWQSCFQGKYLLAQVRLVEACAGLELACGL